MNAPTNIELRHLTALAAVADEGSFGHAAMRLGYTQSTVSQQIAALERAIGGRVFDRPGGPKAVRITPLGMLVLDRARSLQAEIGDLTEAVERFHAGDGRVDIGSFQSISNVLLPTIVRRLRTEHPECEIRLSEEVPGQAPDMGGLDLLFFDGRLDGDLECRKLLDDPYVLVTRATDFPDGPISIDRLENQPMVAYPLVCDQPRMEQALAQAGATPRIVFRSAGDDTLVSMVRAGLGSAVLPSLAAHAAEVAGDDRLRIHELVPHVPHREIFVYSRTGRSHSPLAARTIEIAVEIAADLAAKI